MLSQDRQHNVWGHYARGKEINNVKAVYHNRLANELLVDDDAVVNNGWKGSTRKSVCWSSKHLESRLVALANKLRRGRYSSRLSLSLYCWYWPHAHTYELLWKWDTNTRARKPALNTCQEWKANAKTNVKRISCNLSVKKKFKLSSSFQTDISRLIS